MQRVLKSLEPICRCVIQGEAVSRLDKETCLDALRGLDRQEAQLLYMDLLKIQISVDNCSEPALSVLDPLMDWKDERHLRRFHALLIDDGVYVDRVADGVEYNEETRQQLWNDADDRQVREVNLQKLRAQYQKRRSSFLLESRTINADEYDKLRHRLVDDDGETSAYDDWRAIILSTPEQLSRKAPHFWTSIQISRLQTNEKRALIYKLGLCRRVAPQVSELRDRLIDDIFLVDTNAQSPPRKRSRPPAGRLLCTDLKKMRVRLRRIMKTVRSAQCGSSTPVPAPPPFE